MITYLEFILTINTFISGYVGTKLRFLADFIQRHTGDKHNE